MLADTMAVPAAADLIPAPQFAERHARWIAAPPEAVWDALHEMRLADSPVARALMDVRIVMARPVARGRPAMVTRPFLEAGPVPVVASDPLRSVVAGGVLQPWKLRGGATPPALDAAALRTFEEPGWVKCAVDFVLVPDRDGTRLSTETRVAATDRGTRVRFAVYWNLIRLGSALIRREMLRIVARRAECMAP